MSELSQSGSRRANVDEVSERFERLDGVVGDLSATITGLIAAIPGARRTLRADRSA